MSCLNKPKATIFTERSKNDSSLRAGTFNARSLKSNIKKITIIQDFEQYRLAILGLTETWLNGAGVDTYDNGHVLYRSGGSSSRAGVGLLINKKLINNVESYRFISERMISVRLRDGPRPDSNCLTVVCCYAPTLQCSTSHPQELDDFYSALRGIAREVSRRDEKFL